MKSRLVVLNNKDHENNTKPSDPSHFSPLIERQKKHLKANPNDPAEWIKLGCLYNERASLTERIVQGSFFLRFLNIEIPLFFTVSFLLSYQTGILRAFYQINRLLFVFSLLAIALILIWIFTLRYPRSGSRFFKKAIALDQDHGEAYMHLGFIALRKNQKQKACHLLEHALYLNVDDKSIKKDLRSLYEMEFMKLIGVQQKESQKKQEFIDSLQKQIKNLHAQIHLHKTNIAILKTKTKQTLSNARQTIKHKSKAMDHQISAVEKNYQEKIAEIEQVKTALAEEKAVEPVILVQLTDELFESELKREHLSFHQAAENIKNTVELDLWESLSRQTKYYLVTAEQTFSIFTNNKESKDFSLIGLEYCKALELEINKKLVDPFKDYIKENKDAFLKLDQTGKRKNKPKYRSYLSMVLDETNYPDINSLTLGQFHFVLKWSLKNDYSLQEYKRFIQGVFSNNSQGTLELFSEKLGIVVKRYRNVIAHRSSMNQEECDHLRKLIFLEKDALLRMCVPH